MTCNNRTWCTYHAGLLKPILRRTPLTRLSPARLPVIRRPISKTLYNFVTQLRRTAGSDIWSTCLSDKNTVRWVIITERVPLRIGPRRIAAEVLIWYLVGPYTGHLHLVSFTVLSFTPTFILFDLCLRISSRQFVQLFRHCKSPFHTVIRIHLDLVIISYFSYFTISF